MEFKERYNDLKNILIQTLTPLVNNKYCIVDLPYHSNIGDTLIWQGEMEFLATLNYECVDMSSQLTESLDIDTDTIILFHGGGNIGELYRTHIEYLFQLINRFPQNRIIVFPQTIYYKNENILLEDVSRLNSHGDLHFCVRDKYCFDLYENKIKNLYLLPDMAFCIPLDYFEKYQVRSIKGSLYLKRLDGELSDNNANINTDFVKDWPTFYHKLNDGTFIAKIIDNLCKTPIIGNLHIIKKIWDWWAYNVYRKDLIKIGTEFVKSYDPIYTTRLHVMILSLLCGKKITVVDNSYGKNLNYVKTWLYDIDEISIYPNNKQNNI